MLLLWIPTVTVLCSFRKVLKYDAVTVDYLEEKSNDLFKFVCVCVFCPGMLVFALMHSRPDLNFVLFL